MLVLLSLTACGGGNGSDDPAPSDPPLADSGEVLSTGTYVQGTQSWGYQNLRLPNQTGGFAYAQFFQASGPGPHPVIVMTKPYAGIDWTGEAVDDRWADQYNAYITAGSSPPMCAADVDGPDYDPATSSPTCYTLSTTQQTGEQAFMYLFNNYSVLVVYGRFYSGGDVENDIEDMVAGLRFLGTQTKIDQNQVGIIGGSWGGFEALYSALNAPAGVRPTVAVPMFPVTDFAGLINFINTKLPGLVSSDVLPQYTQFYDPYLRRFYASTGQPPNTNNSGYTLDDLTTLVTAANIPMLIPHDDGDTILPANLSHEFSNANSNLIEGFWYKRLDNAPWQTVITKHGQIEDALLVPIHYTFTTSYLFSRLNDAGNLLYIPYAAQDMLNFFSDIRTYQSDLRDVSWLVPRLIELCDSTIYMYELSPGNATPVTAGAEYVAQSLNTVWGTSLTAATVPQYLIDMGLPPP